MEQTGFCKIGHVPIDKICPINIKKHREYRKETHLLFVDYIKAFEYNTQRNYGKK